MSPVGLIGHAYFPMPMARPRDLQFVATVQSTAARRSTLCQESRLTLLSVVMGKLASWSEDAEAARATRTPCRWVRFASIAKCGNRNAQRME